MEEEVGRLLVVGGERGCLVMGKVLSPKSVSWEPLFPTVAGRENVTSLVRVWCETDPPQADPGRRSDSPDPRLILAT